jgi:hypothetical protein
MRGRRPFSCLPEREESMEEMEARIEALRARIADVKRIAGGSEESRSGSP